MKIFLQAKNWQLFLLFMFPVFMPSIMSASENPMAVFFIVWIIFMGTFILWAYSIGSTANSKLDLRYRKSFSFIRIASCIPIIYGLLLWTNGFPPYVEGKEIAFWFVPMHLLTMFSMFYIIWFAAKQLGTLRTGKNAKFIDYAGLFFLLWFFPIGVWFVQPLVNELLGSNESFSS